MPCCGPVIRDKSLQYRLVHVVDKSLETKFCIRRAYDNCNDTQRERERERERDEDLLTRIEVIKEGD